MKAGVIVFPGSNCDRDTGRACELFGWDVDYLWHDDTDLDKYDVIFVPGGFSYGDYIRSGALAKFSPVVQSLKKYVEDKKGFVVGICNGFQILCESGLLPGALSVNENTKFICDSSKLNIKLADFPSSITLPIAHGEGKYFADEDTLKELSSKNYVLFKYASNPNGSMNDIAGIYDVKKRIIGMMPHPERDRKSVV